VGPKASRWTGTGNLSSTGIRFPGRPAGSESLCRLSYPGPLSTSAKCSVLGYSKILFEKQVSRKCEVIAY
jgi:hypothetical protein